MKGVLLRRRERNRAYRSKIKTYIKKAEEAIEKGEGAEEAVREAISLLDKAVSKGIIHPNKAARKKSSLMKKLNAKGEA